MTDSFCNYCWQHLPFDTCQCDMQAFYCSKIPREKRGELLLKKTSKEDISDIILAISETQFGLTSFEIQQLVNMSEFIRDLK